MIGKRYFTLYQAAEGGDIDTVKHLLTQGDDIHGEKWRATPLHSIPAILCASKQRKNH